MRPHNDDYPPYFSNYVNQVSENNLDEALHNNSVSIGSFLRAIPEEKWDYAYAEGKWTIREMIQHIIDAERIFAYRALCFARKDKTSLPSFDENEYAKSSGANNRSSADLIEEMVTVRHSSILLFKSFTDDMRNETGFANQKPTTVLSLGFILLGHFNHHKKILEQRYL